MKISVVIPTHSRPQYLREAVSSVVNRLYDCSWCSLMTARNRQSTLPSLRKLSAAAASSSGTKSPKGRSSEECGCGAANGDVILILDDDDLLVPTALADIDRALPAILSSTVVYGCRPVRPYAAKRRRKPGRAIARFVEATTRLTDDLYFSMTHCSSTRSLCAIDFQRRRRVRELGNCWRLL